MQWRTRVVVGGTYHYSGFVIGSSLDTILGVKEACTCLMHQTFGGDGGLFLLVSACHARRYEDPSEDRPPFQARLGSILSRCKKSTTESGVGVWGSSSGSNIKCQVPQPGHEQSNEGSDL